MKTYNLQFDYHLKNTHEIDISPRIVTDADLERMRKRD